MQVVGVAQVINKKDEEGPFTATDEKIFEKYLVFCGIGITNALLFQSSVIMYKRSDVSNIAPVQVDKKCAKLLNITHSAVSFLSRASANLCW